MPTITRDTLSVVADFCNAVQPSLLAQGIDGTLPDRFRRIWWRHGLFHFRQNTRLRSTLEALLELATCCTTYTCTSGGLGRMFLNDGVRHLVSILTWPSLATTRMLGFPCHSSLEERRT
jgi:hypothetical protein